MEWDYRRLIRRSPTKQCALGNIGIRETGASSFCFRVYRMSALMYQRVNYERYFIFGLFVALARLPFWRFVSVPTTRQRVPLLIRRLSILKDNGLKALPFALAVCGKCINDVLLTVYTYPFRSLSFQLFKCLFLTKIYIN